MLPLLDLQDGRVGLHDGHDDPVDVVLQAEVDLLLLLDGLHELGRARARCRGRAPPGTQIGSPRGQAEGRGGWRGRYLVAGDGADLCGQGLGEGRGEEVLGALDAQVDDLPVELVVLLLQAAVVLGDMVVSPRGPRQNLPVPHASPGSGSTCPAPHLLQPSDLLLQLALPRAAVVLLQACAAAAAPPLLRLQLEELQVLQLLAQVLDQLGQGGGPALASGPLGGSARQPQRSGPSTRELAHVCLGRRPHLLGCLLVPLELVPLVAQPVT